LGERQVHHQRKGDAAALARRDHDVAAHCARDLLDRGKSEACAAKARGDRDVGLRERAKQQVELFQGEPDTAVGNRKGDARLAVTAMGRGYRQPDRALFGEFDGVVDQILQGRAQPDGIADHKHRQLVGYLDRGLQALGGRPAGERIAGAAGERAQVEQVLPPANRAAASRGIDEQGGEARQMFGAGLDGVDPAPLALAKLGGRQQVADREDAGQRRAHLMRKGSERSLDHARCSPASRSLAPLARPLGLRTGSRLDGALFDLPLSDLPLFGRLCLARWAGFCRHDSGPPAAATMTCPSPWSHGRGSSTALE